MRTLDPTLRAAMLGPFNPYIKCAFLSSPGTLMDVSKYRLTATDLTLDIPELLAYSDQVRIDRGALIDGVANFVSSSYFFVKRTEQKLFQTTQFGIRVHATLIPEIYLTIPADDTYENVISAFCTEIGRTAVLDQPSDAIWGYQFLPTGKHFTTNNAATFLNLLRQKYFIFARDNEDGEIFFYQAMADRTGDEQYTVWYETPAPAEQLPTDIYTHVPSSDPVTTFAQRTYLARDENAAIRTGGTPDSIIHNLGYLESTDDFPAVSEALQEWNTDPFSIHLQPQDGDVFFNDQKDRTLFPAEVIEELDTKKTPSWTTSVGLRQVFANTEGGALPGTIERNAPYTPLNTGTFDKNLNESVNNLQALAEAVDELNINNTGGTPREVLTANRTYYVGHLLGDVAVSIASPAVVTKAAHGLVNGDQVALSILQKRAACTITIASPGVVTRAGHGFAADQPIFFETTNNALPTGITPGTTYYVRNPTTDTFEFAAAAGGASINTSGTQSGSHYVSATGALPTGLVEGTRYYVVNKTTNTFQLSATEGGAAINTSGTQSGLISCRTGSDAHTGLTDSIADALLTTQQAINNLATGIDFAGFTVTIQECDGKYTAAVTLKSMVGMASPASLVIAGNSTYPTNVNHHTTSASCFTLNGPDVQSQVQNLRVRTTTSGMGFVLSNGASLRHTGIQFGAIANHGMQVENSRVSVTGPYFLDGNCTFHFFATGSAYVGCESIGTVTLLNQPTFTYFVRAQNASVFRINGNTYSGTAASGTRYSADSQSLIFVNAAGEAYFPGTLVGTMTNGGRYDVPPGTTRVSTQFNKSNNTLANITGLTATLLAGRTYRFRAHLLTTSNVASGIRAAIAGTCTATAIIYKSLIDQAGLMVAGGTNRATALGTQVADVTAVTVANITIEGTITVNAAGTLTVQFANNAGANTSSVLVGSTFEVEDVTP